MADRPRAEHIARAEKLAVEASGLARQMAKDLKWELAPVVSALTALAQLHLGLAGVLGQQGAEEPKAPKAVPAPLGDRFSVGNIIWTRGDDGHWSFGSWRVEYRTPYALADGWYVVHPDRCRFGKLLPTAESERDALAKAGVLAALGNAFPVASEDRS